MAEYDARMYPEDLTPPYRLDWSRFYSPTTSQARMYGEPAIGIAAPVPEIDLSISSIDVLNPTNLRLNFDVPAKDNEALRSANNYVITPSLEIFSVTPEAVANPTHVVLTTAEQKQGESYALEIKIIEAA